MQTFFKTFWILSLAYATCVLASMETVHQWKYFNYAWDSTHEMNNYLLTGKYNHEKMIPIDVAQSLDGKIFLTITKGPGVPASLNIVSDKNKVSGPLLLPYPNWDAHEKSQLCDSIINIQRITIDECNRLWGVDTGTIDGSNVCPAKLLVFNVYTNTMVFNIEIARKVSINGKKGFLGDIVVDTTGMDCEMTVAYIADPTGFGLVIYSSESHRFRRREDVRFQPDKVHSLFTIAGETFEQGDGISALSLSPMDYPDGGRHLGFKPLASRSIYTIPIGRINGKKISKKTPMSSYVNVLPSQASVLTFSESGVLFYALTKEAAIGCWNKYRLDVKNAFITLLTDHERLQFVTGMKIFKDTSQIPHQEYLLLLSNRRQKVQNQSMKFYEINFRILKVSVKYLVRNTICDI